MSPSVDAGTGSAGEEVRIDGMSSTLDGDLEGARGAACLGARGFGAGAWLGDGAAYTEGAGGGGGAGGTEASGGDADGAEGAGGTHGAGTITAALTWSG